MAQSVGDSSRGTDAVRTALIEAAASRLSEAGPRSVSVRDIARRAGVNHGQVHHYFGSKRGLLVAAMKKLAQDHFEATRTHSGGNPIPPLFVLAEDPDYWRAVCQIMMEGDIDLARIEVDEGISVPRTALASLMEQYGIASDDLDFKARFAMMAALQLGWVALEDFIMLISDVAE
ncbi:MAG: TetR family transcriptional regulator, partial [bacterium]|nr:TetR family transcriptional regulator [bacterium]